MKVMIVLDKVMIDLEKVMIARERVMIVLEKVMTVRVRATIAAATLLKIVKANKLRSNPAS